MMMRKKRRRKWMNQILMPVASLFPCLSLCTKTTILSLVPGKGKTKNPINSTGKLIDEKRNKNTERERVGRENRMTM